MPPRISSEVCAAIWAHHQNLLSGQKISDMLKAAGMTASKRAVNKIIKEIPLERQGIVKLPKRLGTQNSPSVRTPALIKKVKNLLNRPNPYTQPDIGRMLGVSQSTVRNIAKFDLGGEVRKKTRTHALSDKHVAQRVAKSPRSLNQIHRQKWKFIISIDDAWCYMSHVNGCRRIYYKFRGNKREPSKFLKILQQKRPKGVMFVAGISSRDLTAIRFVPPNTKVNSAFYTYKILMPIQGKDIPWIFGKDAKRVALHHESASSHTSGPIVKWLESNNYNFIPAADWPTNSPDFSPMDCSINGIFKRRLSKRKSRGLPGLMRVMKDERSKISVELWVNTLEPWEKRVKLMIQNKGSQIEHLK
jgi:hypothetical protein